MTDLASKVRSLLRPEVLALSAYHVPDSSGYVKLDAMENPYSWPDDMVEAWLARLREAQPNRYPDPACSRLRAKLREAYGVPEGAELLMGNGSDEIIQIILMALQGRDATVLAPEPTFVMYRQIASCLGLKFVGVPLREADFSLDMVAMRTAIEKHRPAVIFLAYPNNPTGNVFDPEDVAEILQAAPGLVVLDEAYTPYAGRSFMPRLAEFERLLVMRTLSKLGLAGLRLGLLAGARAWIDEFDKIRLPYNINILTQISTEFAIEKREVFEAQVKLILRDRQYLHEELSRLTGVHVYRSDANFILFRLLRHDANQVFQGLKSSGVLIKNLHPSGGQLSGCLRVTVGMPEENDKFLAVLAKILAS
ncbi:histidinol-phosphate transaminase [Methylocaldum sp.]|uniref:histidinol-phosphate transaminase n=1 Tax=Methylocaldum sp. TaxID=1969727 RepID=UPI002D726292|nr:histidinol-phosphate transaminase [Methylocaldum sp.]HYE36107.1 histidinol-phosphate transaminase [Methylocaldum sp.]